MRINRTSTLRYALCILHFALCTFTAYADTFVVSGTTMAAGANSISGSGFTLTISGNASKNWTNGNGSMSYGGKTHTTLKNSNGAQNTLTLPAGCKATKVDFYVVANPLTETTNPTLSEVNGQTQTDEVTSRDYAAPTHLSYTLDSVSYFTFTFATKQVCFIAVVTYSGTRTASSVDSYSWAHICAGKVAEAGWYASAEAQQIADIVLAVQKNNGGWMKNDELHKLSSSDYARLLSEKGTHSCLDNYATTQEMRYLARIYAESGVETYRQGFLRGLNLILTAQHAGGWSQYWPLTNDGGYQDYITFNDDLMTNVMKMLRDVYEAQGNFASLTDNTMQQQCRAAFDTGLDCILNCQIDIDGTLSGWCAQHDTVAPYYPMEGRPHELPSVSACESATLLSFLMTIDNPSPRLWTAITSGVAWFDQHKIANKKIQDYTNAMGQPDRLIVSSQGDNLWGRFIQIGGQSGLTIYQHFFQKLQTRGRQRSYTANGTKYTYSEYQIASSSFNSARANKPIFAIYKDSIQHMYYRFLYDYAPTTITTTVGASVAYLADGCPVYTTLMATNRANYQYLGNWMTRVISTDYPKWHRKYPTCPSALENLDTNPSAGSTPSSAVKTLRNGQVIITRAGVEYNALGIRL